MSHEAQNIPTSVRIKNLSLFEVVNRDALYRYFSAGGGNLHVFTFMRARNGPASNNFFSLGNQVFNGETEVRQGGNHFHDSPFVRLRTYLRTGRHRVAECMARGDEFVHNFKLAVIPNLFIEAANDGLVVYGH